jgi:hypothetical protein
LKTAGIKLHAGSHRGESRQHLQRRSSSFRGPPLDRFDGTTSAQINEKTGVAAPLPDRVVIYCVHPAGCMRQSVSAALRLMNPQESRNRFGAPRQTIARGPGHDPIKLILAKAT